MTTLALPKAPDYTSSSTPGDWLPGPEQLADSLAEAASESPDGFGELARQLAAPFVDLAASPLTARATVLGAEGGRAFYHHELRRRLEMPAPLAPEVSVWEGGTTPGWADGVLAEPKYFSFFQEAPLPAYNPNHRRKWRAHELLHGASRFFWHPRMTRFEFYVSARLNELIPVVHWYNLDEVYRTRCPDHEDTVLHRDHCLKCQNAAEPYWKSDAFHRRERREAATRLIERGWRHFEEEWDAIADEIETGQRRPTPRPHLDASSDAVGYMRAHWNRVTAWSFGRWVETFLEEGVDYFSSLSALRDHVGQTFRRLVSGTVSLSADQHLAKRTRSQLQDVGYRVLLALEWLEPETEDTRKAEQVLMPQLDRCAELAARLVDDPEAIEEGLEQFARTCHEFSRVSPRFPDEISDAFLGFGYRFVDPQVFSDAALGQVYSGLEDGMPQTVSRLEEPLSVIRHFMLSDRFDEHGRLSGRFARWLEKLDEESRDELSVGELTVELARFEAFANGEPRKDDEATNFASLPEHASQLRDQPGRLRPNRTLRRDRFSAGVIGEVTGEPLDETGPIDIAASLVDGDLRMVIEDEYSSEVLNRITAGEAVEEWWDFQLADAVMTLLEHSLITWLPTPQS